MFIQRHSDIIIFYSVQEVNDTLISVKISQNTKIPTCFKKKLIQNIFFSFLFKFNFMPLLIYKQKSDFMLNWKNINIKRTYKREQMVRHVVRGQQNNELTRMPGPNRRQRQFIGSNTKCKARLSECSFQGPCAPQMYIVEMKIYCLLNGIVIFAFSFHFFL